MKRILVLLVVVILISTNLGLAPSRPFFQVVKKTRHFLVNGEVYSFNAQKFREQYQEDTCVLAKFCNMQNYLFVKNVSLVTGEPGVKYGQALVARDKPNNRWLCLLFVSVEDVEMLGPVTDLFPADSNKAYITVRFTAKEKSYLRWDVGTEK